MKGRVCVAILGMVASLLTFAARPAGAAVPAVAGDFNNDGKADISLFRPSDGAWQVRNVGTVNFGASTDIPVPADYDNDGDMDHAVYRRSTGTWHLRNIGNIAFGTPADIPVPGDYTGTDAAEVGVFRPSTATWHIQGLSTVQYGASTDIPVPYDYDRDGDTDIAVFRPSGGTWHVLGQFTIQYGTTGDIPVPGDYNKDGTVDLAVFRPSDSKWYVRGVGTTAYGTTGDIPQPADYDGDGDTDISVFRPSTATWHIQGQAAIPWGAGTDIPTVMLPSVRLTTTRPVLGNDALTATGNIGIRQVATSGALFLNDTGGGLRVSEVQGSAANVGVPVNTTAVGRNGRTGRIDLEADGSYEYTPPPGHTGTDTFTYKARNAGGQSSLAATVTITITDTLWFVCDACVSDNLGSLAHPFTSTGALTTANTGSAPNPQPGDKIYVRSGTYDAATDTLALRPNQLLYGQGVAAASVVAEDPKSVPALAALTAGTRPTLAPTAGNGITVAADNTIQHLNVGNTAASAAADIAGSGIGTLSISNVNLTGTGQALNLANGTLNGAFGTLTSTSGTANLSLSGVGGTVTVADSLSVLQSATGRALSLTNGSVNLTYPGGVTNSGQGILIQGSTGGAVALQGKLTLTPSSGNRGLEVNGTSGGATFVATHGDNTVSSTGAVAVWITNATIGAAGVLFDTVSASGGSNGIILSNTGSAGGLTVTGTGGAGSGGTIQNTTGNAVSLTQTKGVSLASMNITGAGGSGVAGTSVTDFALTGSTVSGSGDDAAADEAGIRFSELTGTAAITNTVVTGSIEDNARVVNSTGALTLNVSGSTFSAPNATTGNDGLLLHATGGTITSTVTGSSFTGNRSVGLHGVTSDSGNLTVNVGTVGVANSGGTFANNNVGIDLAHNSSGTFGFHVTRATLSSSTNTRSVPINVNRGSAATGLMAGQLTNNNVSNGDSPVAPGIQVFGNGPDTTNPLTVRIANNVIQSIAHFGISVATRDGASRVNASIFNNNVSLTNAAALDAIRVRSALNSGDTGTICAVIEGNTATSSGTGATGIRVDQRNAGPFLIEDYSGAPTDTAAVQTFLASRNTATTAATVASVGFTNTNECPVPA